jgi:hypothetical protein
MPQTERYLGSYLSASLTPLRPGCLPRANAQAKPGRCNVPSRISSSALASRLSGVGGLVRVYAVRETEIARGIVTVTRQARVTPTRHTSWREQWPVPISPEVHTERLRYGAATSPVVRGVKSRAPLYKSEKILFAAFILIGRALARSAGPTAASRKAESREASTSRASARE